MTVVTHRDELETNEDCDNAKLDASAATGSSLDHVFFMANYTKQNSARNLEIERMAFDILHYALLSAERAVKLMKQKLKNAEEDEMMRELEKHSISGQVAPDSANGKVVLTLKSQLVSSRPGSLAVAHACRCSRWPLVRGLNLTILCKTDCLANWVSNSVFDCFF